jgi:uncharacterized secreted protein with C-terminal beta-propeller domain
MGSSSKLLKSLRNLKTSTKLIIAAGGLLLFAFFCSGITTILVAGFKLYPNFLPDLNPIINSNKDVTNLKQFNSEEAFQQYIQEGIEITSSQYSAVSNFEPEVMLESSDLALGNVTSTEETKSSERTSTTNVQVKGIDEPDIVKQNDENLFYSQVQRYGIYSGNNYYSNNSETHILDSTNLENIKKIEDIDNAGQLLLSEKHLIILAGDEISGYNIETPEDPDKEWDTNLEDNTTIVSARLYNKEIYLVTSTRLGTSPDCNIPILDGDIDFEVRCDNVYYPEAVIPVDSTYTIMKIDPKTGSLVDSTSFVGTLSQSTVYMSEENIFVTYYFPGDIVAIKSDFVEENKNFFGDDLVEKVRKLETYDISYSAKKLEIDILLQNFIQNAPEDLQDDRREELEKKEKEYLEEHKRDLEKTGIVKLNNNNLNIKAVGEVPGKLLNQFSLDEYNDNLRVATTVGENWWLWRGNDQSANDVYILNPKMQQAGKITDLGEGERIYSVRFIEDKGYLVTYRQIDPFYILDLSDPSTPRKTGELKIPGYSSYLHPLSDNLILGIGKEDWKVKLSVFDVSDTENPKEVDKKILDDYYSQVISNHHAFLLDAENKYFFIPGSNNGYIFSYDENGIELEKTFENTKPVRGLYKDNYFILVGREELKTYEIGEWQEVDSLELN